MPYKKITIVNVDGRAGELKETQNAILHSAQQLPGAHCLLISPQRPQQLPDFVQHVSIKPMGHLEYSIFVTYVLHNFIKTDFALIVQNDGWVLNGQSIRDDFFDYDYIGAPTSMANVITPREKRFVRGFGWTPYVREMNAPGVKVNFSMNGGFSLRSLKFLRTPTELGISYSFSPPNLVKNGANLSMFWENGDAWEDVYHCVINRDVLESSGIKFAPLHLAKYFSFEHLNPFVHSGMNLSDVFGHHAGIRLLSSIDPMTIKYLTSEKDTYGIIGEAEVVDYFRRAGYRVIFNH